MQRSSLWITAALAASLSGLAQARPPHPPQAGARLVQRQGDQLTLSRDQGWHKDVFLDQNTSFYDGRDSDPGLRERLRPGDWLDIRDRLDADGRWHVQEVHRRKGPPVHGRVLGVNANGFLIDNHGEAVQVDVSESTRYRFGWLPGSKAAVAANRPAAVEGKQVGPNHVEASQVDLPFPWMTLVAALGLSGLVAGITWRRRRS